MDFSRQPMLTMDGSMMVSFGIDPDRASERHKARLVEAGASIRIMGAQGYEVGPIFPVPSAWFHPGSLIRFRGPLMFHYWSGMPDWYCNAVMRIAPSSEFPQVPEIGLTIVLEFKRVAFGPKLVTHVDLRGMEVIP